MPAYKRYKVDPLLIVPRWWLFALVSGAPVPEKRESERVGRVRGNTVHGLYEDQRLRLPERGDSISGTNAKVVTLPTNSKVPVSTVSGPSL